MKNSYVILGLIAVAAIGFVFWYMFMKSPKYSGWSTFKADVAPAKMTKCWCKDRNGNPSGVCLSANGSCSCCSGYGTYQTR